MARLTTASKLFQVLVANIDGAGDPSQGRNPTKIRQKFTYQVFTEVPRESNESNVGNPQTPGLRSSTGALYNSAPGVSGAGSEGTVTVDDVDFTAPAILYLGAYTVTSGEDYDTGAVQAEGAFTVVATPSTANLNIGGQALTANAGARTPGMNDYDGTLGTPALIATEIAAAINDGANGFTAIVTAANLVGAAVELTAVPVGAAGNAITLTTSDIACVTKSGATLTGGVDADDNAAANLATAINGLPGFSAVAAAEIVTVTGPSGPNGNNVLFEAVYTGTVANFTLSPTADFLDGAEPHIGPPLIS